MKHFDSDYANGYSEWMPYITLYRHSKPSEIKVPKEIIRKKEKVIQASIVGIELGAFYVQNIDDSLEEAQVLTTAAAGLTTSLNGLISDMDYILVQLAQGDFTVESRNSQSYIGDFESLLGSVRELKLRLSKTLQHIQESANQVMHGSSQMATSAQDLAYGAANQTEALNTLRHTIVNITDGVAMNAQQSKAALINKAGNTG